MNEVFRLLQGVTGWTGEAKYGPARVGDVKHSLADITRARQALGYEPNYSFEQGLGETIAWYRATAKIAQPAPQ